MEQHSFYKHYRKQTMIDRPAKQKHGLFHSSAILQCKMLPLNSAVINTQAIPLPTFKIYSSALGTQNICQGFIRFSQWKERYLNITKVLILVTARVLLESNQLVQNLAAT